MTERMGERGRQGAAPLGGQLSDERWEHIRLGLGFILLRPDTMVEHQIAVEAYEGLKADYEAVVEAVRSFVDFTEAGQYRNNEGSKAYMFNRLREALRALDG